ncbi:uncharacterized protein LOC132200601 isoform X2 [Neocloeon triangulifer]|nr:uncharacterized protein LOC132200601 isoform X2 [Neocloeon triangulifer]
MFLKNLIFAFVLVPVICRPKERKIRMGVSAENCDNGRKNLHVDWDQSKVNYTCYEKNPYPVLAAAPVEECFEKKRFKHKCMNVPISYNDSEPVYGNHRPLWAVYGEYRFLPPQRWLHNLEHGGIVMLYHPCAYSSEVEKLRQIVKKCNSRHIITAHNLLPAKTPLALIAYGCRRYMSHLDKEGAVKFIQDHAHNAIENNEFREGQFDVSLIEPSLNLSLNLIHNNTDLCVGM